MLGKLFGSKTRVGLLKLFLSNVDDKYYIRQIARELDLQLNSVRRELENLEKFGLLKIEKNENEQVLLNTEVIDEDDKNKSGRRMKTVKRTKDGKIEKKYFSVNKDFVLYEEIKSLISKSQAMYENDIIDKILEVSKPKVFILSGFFVNNPDSDVDLLLVGKINKGKVLSIISRFEKSLNREINYTILAEDEFIYRRDMTDVFLYNILGNKNITVIDEIGAGKV